MEEQYTERINRLFQRLANIQSDVEEEKVNRYKALETILINLEQKVEEINKNKLERHQQLLEKVKFLQNSLEENVGARQKIEGELGNDLKSLQANCRTIIEAANIDHDEQNKKFLGKINRQIEILAKDLSTELSKQDTQSYLQNFLEEDLPRLREDLNNEIATRKELETKIYDQFIGQLRDLQENFDKEKKDRERRADEFMEVLKRFSDNISEDIANSREEREKNNEMLLGLVENVVERIKKEALEVFH